MNKEKNTQEDKMELLFEINEYVSNISFLFKKIDVMLDDISFDLYEKVNLESNNHTIALEDVLSIIQIKHQILCKYTTEIRNKLPDLYKAADSAYNVIKSESNSVQ